MMLYSRKHHKIAAQEKPHVWCSQRVQAFQVNPPALGAKQIRNKVPITLQGQCVRIQIKLAHWVHRLLANMDCKSSLEHQFREAFILPAADACDLQHLLAWARTQLHAVQAALHDLQHVDGLVALEA